MSTVLISGGTVVSATGRVAADVLIDVVLSRGTVIVDDSGYIGKAGHGQYLKRGLSQYLS